MSECERCGEDATREWDHGYDYAFWTRQPRRVPVCDECYQWYDNREPPDPDGEAFRGGEAAAYRAERMAEWQRLK